MLDQTLQQLSDPKQTLTHKALLGLSGLDPTELAALQQAWPTIADARRRQIAHAVVETAEDDVEMDFVDLYRILLGDSDGDVRATAVSGLWETTDESFVDPLLTLLNSDPAPDVRAAAADLLGRFGIQIGEQKKRSKRLALALLAAFYGTDDPANTDIVRRNAIEAVASFSDDKQVIAAINTAYTDASLTVRSGAVGAMGQTFDQTWATIVVKELDNPEPEMRYVAARAAGEMLLEDAAPRIAAMTKDPDTEVQLMAVWALGEIGGLQAKTTLTQLLESHNEGLRDAAEEALDNLRFNENPLDLAGLFGSAKGGKGKQADK